MTNLSLTRIPGGRPAAVIPIENRDAAVVLAGMFDESVNELRGTC
jgi:hypothetical protein